MKWPELAHGKYKWRPAKPKGLDKDDPYGYTFRTCGYCGGMHPEDLVRLLREEGAELGGSDWKYGWPHKFYVERVRNPLAGQLRNGISRWVNDEVITELTPAPEFTFAKWYNVHFLDSGYDEEAYNLLRDTINMHSGILFTIEEGRLRYQAPFWGYQHVGKKTAEELDKAIKNIRASREDSN